MTNTQNQRYNPSCTFFSLKSTTFLILLFVTCTLSQPSYLVTYEWGAQNGDSTPTSVVYHTKANAIYAAGYTKGWLPTMNGKNAGSSDVFVSILPLSAGPLTFQWGTEFEDVATAVAYDVTRSLVYVAGWTNGVLNPGAAGFGAEDAFLTTVTYNGATATLTHNQWGTTGTDKPVCALIDPRFTASLYVGGTTTGSFSGYKNKGGDDIFVSVASTSSVSTTVQWGTSGMDEVGGCSFDTTTGIFYVAGHTSGAFPGFNNSGSYDPFVSILRRNGSLQHIQWGTPYTEVVTGAYYNTRIKAILVTGYTNGAFGDTKNMGAQDAFMTVIYINDNDGSYTIQNHQWGTDGNDVPTGIAADLIYNTIYVSGYTSGLFATKKYENANNGGASDAFMSVFAASNPEWEPNTVQWGTNQTDQCIGVAASSLDQNVYCLGWTSGVFPNAEQKFLVDYQMIFASGVRKEILPPPSAPPVTKVDELTSSAWSFSPNSIFVIFGVIIGFLANL